MKYFIVDGSEGSFYTAVFYAYKEKDCAITSESDLQMSLDGELVEIKEETDKAQRVKNKLYLLDKNAPYDVTILLLSNDKKKELTAFRYIKLIIENKGAVRSMLAHPTVMAMTDIRSRVLKELDRMKGFLRFMENADGVLYAPYSPDNDITALIAPHFTRRFGNQKFVIHDVKRKIAALYDGREIFVSKVEGADIYLSKYEKTFEALWKQYYKSVNISSRPHEKQMKGYMPVRYWKFLPEKE